MDPNPTYDVLVTQLDIYNIYVTICASVGRHKCKKKSCNRVTLNTRGTRSALLFDYFFLVHNLQANCTAHTLRGVFLNV